MRWLDHHRIGRQREKLRLGCQRWSIGIGRRVHDHGHARNQGTAGRRTNLRSASRLCRGLACRAVFGLLACLALLLFFLGAFFGGQFIVAAFLFFFLGAPFFGFLA
jgi:hypothetical protein